MFSSVEVVHSTRTNGSSYRDWFLQEPLTAVGKDYVDLTVLRQQGKTVVGMNNWNNVGIEEESDG